MPATKPRAYQVYDIDWKQAVRALSDSNINLASPGALVIDAVVLDPYDRVLLTAQTDATQNGIYQVNAAQTLLVPAPDWININSGLSSAVNSGLTVSVTDGAEYAQTTWTLTTPNPVIIGTTPINFARTPDQISNVAIDGTNIELANNASETSVSIRPSGTAGLVGITVPDDATADVANLHIYNLVANGNVKVSTAGGDWLYDTQGDFAGAGNVSAGYFLGNGTFLTGISALGSFIANGTSTVDIGTVDGNVVVTTDGANAWTFDTAGNLTMPGSLVAETAGNTGSLRWEINGSNLNVLKLIPDDNLVPQDRYVVIDPYNTGHIHIRAGGIQDASNSYLYLGGEDVHVEVDDFTKEIRVKTYDVVGVSAYQFSFNNNGSFQSPNGIITGGNLSVSGNVSGQYFIGNGAFLTGISAGSSYSNANVANYLPTYAGNLGAGNINFVNGSTIKTAVNNVNMNANTGGAVEITTDGGNYTWSYDNYGWMYLPQAQAAYTPVANGSVLFGSEALVFKAGYANLIFDNTGNTTTANYFLGNVQGLVGSITNLDSLNFAVENISALVANNGVNIGAGGFNNLLVLPTDVVIQNVPLSVAANIVGVTADNDGRIEWMGNSSGDGGGYTTLTLTPDDTVNDQVLVLDPTAPGHIHLRAPGIGGNVEQPTANIFLGPENTNFEITAQYGNAPEARIHSGGYTWTFGNDGNLTVPGNIAINGNNLTWSNAIMHQTGAEDFNIVGDGNVNIGAHGYNWTFGADANLILAGDMILSGDTMILGSETALLQPVEDMPLSLITTGSNGTVTSLWVEDFANVGTSNIAAIYTPLPGTGKVRIVTGNNAGTMAIYDFANDGVFTAANIAATYAYGDTTEANVFVGGTANIVGNVTAGNFIGSGSNVDIVAGSYDWTFGNDGNLALPGNTSNINYANGISILDGYATVSSQYFSNATSQSYNDFVTGNYYNASTLELDYTAYTGASQLALYVDYQAPLTPNIGISVGAVNAPLIQANANIVLEANSGTPQTWTFDTGGNTTLPSTGYLIVTSGIIGSGSSPAPTLSGFSSISTTGAQGNIRASGNLIANVGITTVGNVTGNYFIGNGSLLTGLSASSNYGNSNVANFLAAYGSNTIVTTGNITAGNLIGNISITGNVTGTSANVTLVAGSYNWTFNNTGNLVLPANTFGVNYANGTAVQLGGAGNYGNANVVANLAALGINPISTTSNITAGNLIANDGINTVGNVSAGNIAVAGIVTFADATYQTTAWTGLANNYIALGTGAGGATQSQTAVAIGVNAGNVSQDYYTVAIGIGAGRDTQLAGAIAIGGEAGGNSQGTNAIAIGYRAGRVNQANNSIVLNSTGANLNANTANTLTIAPIRNTSGTDGVLQYNNTTKEVSYGSTLGGNLSVTGNITADGIGTNLIRRASFIGTANTAVTLDNFQARLGGSPVRLYINTVSGNATLTGTSQTYYSGGVNASQWVNVPVGAGAANAFAMSGAVSPSTGGEMVMLNFCDQISGTFMYRVTAIVANTASGNNAVTIERLA